VRLKEYGSKLVEVIDDGDGVEESNFEGLTLKYHTSKLRDFSELQDVSTFGFRGEALSSVCALCNVSISTCHKEATQGTLLKFDHHGVITSKKPCAREASSFPSCECLTVKPKLHLNQRVSGAARTQPGRASLCRGGHILLARIQLHTTRVSLGQSMWVKSSSSHVSPRTSPRTVEGRNARVQNTLFDVKQYNSRSLKASQIVLGRGRIKRIQYISCQYRGARSAQHLNEFNQHVSCSRHTGHRTHVCHTRNRAMFNLPLLSELVNLSSTSIREHMLIIPASPFRSFHAFARFRAPLHSATDSTASTVADPYLRSEKSEVPGRAGSDGGRRRRCLVDSGCKCLFHSQKFGPLGSGVKRAYSATSSPIGQSLSLQSFKFRRTEATSNEQPDELSISADSVQASSEFEEASSFNMTGVSTLGSDPDDEAVLNIDKLQTTSLQADSQVAPETASQTASLSTLQATQLVSLSSDLSDLSGNTLTPDSETLSGQETAKDALRESLVEPTHHLLKVTGGTECCPGAGTLPCSGPSLSYDRTTSLRVPASSSGRFGSRKGSDDGKLGTTVGLRLLEAFRFGSNSTYAEQTEAVQQLSKRTALENTSTSKGGQNLEASDTVLDDSESDSVISGCGVLHGSGDPTKPERSRGEEFELDKRSGVSRKFRTLEFSLSRLLRRTKESQHGCSASDKGHSKVPPRKFRAAILPSDNGAAENELAKEISKDMFGQMEIIGQFNLGFIVAKLGDDLFIVDQHAADEKYNFERLEHDTIMKGQRLIAPQALELTAVNESVLVENQEVFEKNGFAFEVDESQPSGQKVKLVSVPVSGSWQFGKEGKSYFLHWFVHHVDELIFMLSDNPHTVCRPTKARQMFASRACRKSVMVGMPLTLATMGKVVSHLGELHHPWNCPHGRPTMRHLVSLAILPD
ncbi:unnamed protein product, partial [Ixodes hexagonus]